MTLVAVPGIDRAPAPAPPRDPRLGRYVPTHQLGTGPDGTALRAEDAAGRPAELLFLAGAPAGGERWTAIEQRVRRLGVVEHPVLRGVLELDAHNVVPLIVLEALPTVTLRSVIRQPPLARSEVLRIAERLAHGLSSAHRVGLHHGALGPRAVLLAANAVPRLDLTGVQVGTVPEADALDRACVAPELATESSDSDSDVYSLGVILLELILGRAPTDAERAAPTSVDNGPLGELITAMLGPVREARPSAAEACLELRHAQRAGGEASIPGRTADGLGLRPDLAPPVPSIADLDEGDTVKPVTRSLVGETLGRFQLVKLLGAGAMGEVYQAVDVADGALVAVKVLRSHLAAEVEILRRFKKEARLLGELRNPYIVGLLDVNTDHGVHYIAMEYVSGPCVSDVLDRAVKFPEREALAIAADICRALAEAHARGIVHRDIKPENMMFQDANASVALEGARVKLCDFGIARQSRDQKSTRLTTDGTVVGTPLFMSPEQCRGSDLGPPADVYSLGATLFLFIAGRAPFEGEDGMDIMLKHVHEAPPALNSVAREVSDATNALVARALEKEPLKRFADAGEMLEAIERILRGEPAAIDVHPQVPAVRPNVKVVTHTFEWVLASPPDALWPYVSNTQRMNHAVGVPPVDFEIRAAPGGGSEAVGSQRVAGMNLKWREHPFEWVEGRRWAVLRVFESGVMRWYVVELELIPRGDGGTLVRWSMKFEPKNIFSRWIVAFEVGFKQRRAMDRMFRRIDAALRKQLPSGEASDAFEPEEKLSYAAEQIVARVSQEIVAEGVDPAAVEVLATYVRYASPQELSRIRPLELAARFKVSPEQLVAACLHAARKGLLVLLWDVICPLCRIPSDFVDSLQSIAEHSNCKACNADFKLDFARSIEMIFRVSPTVRPTETRTFCIGGPSHSPHVVAQVRLGVGERFVLPLALEPGPYRLRSPQLPDPVDLRVATGVHPRRLDLRLGRADKRALEPTQLAVGEQVIALTNDVDRELVVRLERVAPREDALTAARASSLALFRELFPGEVLAPGQLVSVTNVVMLCTALDGAAAMLAEMGDARAFEVLLRHFHVLAEAIAEEGGALMKTVGHGVVASFESPVAAVRAALGLRARLANDPRTQGLTLRAAAHQGPAMAATINDRLDYFGRTPDVAFELLGYARPGQLLLGRAVAADPDVSALLYARGVEARTQSVEGIAPAFWGTAVSL